MGLFKPAWQLCQSRDCFYQTKRFFMAQCEIDEMGDQALLLRVVMESSVFELQTHAAKRITDKIIIEQELLHNKNPAVRRIALKTLDNQEAIIQTALNDNDITVREYAVERITDQATLQQLVLRSSFANTTSLAWSKLNYDIALETAKKLDIEPEYVCKHMGAHCNAPGPIIQHIEEDYDAGFKVRESYNCLLCGKTIARRSRGTIVCSDKSKRWEYLDIKK